MSLPQKNVEQLQGTSIAALAPFWQSLAAIPPSVQSLTSSNIHTDPTVQQLKIENLALRKEIGRLQEIVKHERSLLLLADSTYSQTSKRHQQQAEKLFSMHIEAIPAQVIFRAASSWSSSLWINVGNADNKSSEVIAKNSPVVVGNALVGVVDYVGTHQSRIRLITDSGLNPSVRVARPVADDSEEMLYLAKGELHGSSNPLWRSRGQLLHGIGFNFDFADEEGPPRELRSAIPILKVNDTLVTTGMDGVFPAGLHVATVTNVHLLREGDYYYEIEAEPSAGNLNNLSVVYVMPPVGYDAADIPPPLGN